MTENEHERRVADTAHGEGANEGDEGGRPSPAAEQAAKLTPADDSTPPHPSPAEGAGPGAPNAEGSERPPRPSQAEGER